MTAHLDEAALNLWQARPHSLPPAPQDDLPIRIQHRAPPGRDLQYNSRQGIQNETPGVRSTTYCCTPKLINTCSQMQRELHLFCVPKNTHTHRVCDASGTQMNQPACQTPTSTTALAWLRTTEVISCTMLGCTVSKQDRNLRPSGRDTNAGQIAACRAPHTSSQDGRVCQRGGNG